MFIRLFLLFTVIPFIELYILIEIGSIIGSFNTILIVILTGAVGAAMAKSQGFLIIRQINAAIERGEVPAMEIIEGVLVLVGGVALLTPGILTDLAGLIVIFPFTRKLIVEYLTKYFSRKFSNGKVIIDVKNEE